MALTSSSEEVSRDAQERQIRAQQEMQAAAQEAATLKELADIQPLAPQQPTRLPIDWQHSADRAAARAANLEQMQLQHQQRLAEMQAREQAERDSLAYKMQMQAKYAPKRTGGGGGAGYMTSLQREYLKLSREVPNDPETKKRWRQSLAAYELAIKKSGKSGVEFLDASRVDSQYLTYLQAEPRLEWILHRLSEKQEKQQNKTQDEHPIKLPDKFKIESKR